MSDQNKRHTMLSGKEIEDLPSYGVGHLLMDEAAAKRILRKIQSGQSDLRTGVTSEAGPSGMEVPTQQESVTNNEIRVYVEETSNQELDESATEPIGATTDMSQIMENSDSMMEVSGTKEPTLGARITTPYMRFRYMSEKTQGKGKKGGRTRQFDSTVSDDEKHCLAEVWIENYVGSAKIVAFCVDSDGKLHPYNLYGDNCHNGVYVRKENCRPGKIFKLNRVTVTTPKEKEYQENLKNQLEYLHNAGIQDTKFCADVKDKQIVYVMFKAILMGDKPENTILSYISTPIQNKKKGKEFKIEDIEPASAPASGNTTRSNVQKNRVMMHVTEETNFPAEAGVKIRERGKNGQFIWETEPNEIKVIRQCVVKFNPPPYKNPATKEDVEVEICLYDKKTRIETEPVKFVYTAADSGNLENKAKKRKLDELIDISGASEFQPEKLVASNKKTLSAIKRSQVIGSSSKEDVQDDELPQESEQYLEMSETPSQLLAELMVSVEGNTVSLQSQRPGQLPFTTYSENQNVGNAVLGISGSQQMQLPSRQQSAGFADNQSTVSHQEVTHVGDTNLVVTSTTSVLDNTRQLQAIASTSNTSAYSYQEQQQQQQQQQVADQNPSAVLLTDEDIALCNQQGMQLPKLGPNQCLAIMNGQIYVVQDDVGEASASATAAPPTSYQSSSLVQNISCQQVIVQQMPPQHPSSEAESATMTTNRSASTSCRSTSRSAPITSSPASGQQQQLQQQQLKFLEQVVGALGVDVSKMPVEQQLALLQQVVRLQSQGLAQSSTDATSSNTPVSYGNNLDDSDIETDGGTVKNGQTEQQATFSSINSNRSSSEQRNKKLKSCNTNSGRNKISQKGGVLPTVVDDPSEDISLRGKKGGKHIDYEFQNGSFDNAVD